MGYFFTLAGWRTSFYNPSNKKYQYDKKNNLTAYIQKKADMTVNLVRAVDDGVMVRNLYLDQNGRVTPIFYPSYSLNPTLDTERNAVFDNDQKVRDMLYWLSSGMYEHDQ